MSAFMEDPSYLQKTHDLSPTNHTANSILFFQLFLSWLRHMTNHDGSKDVNQESNKDSDKKKRRGGRPFLRLDEFSPGEFTFTGSLDDDGYPVGPGLLTLPADGSGGFCLRGVCDKGVSFVNGTFVDGGLLHGWAAVIFGDGSHARAVFDRGVRHGFSLDYNKHGQLIEVAEFEEGKPSATSSRWKITNEFGTALYGGGKSGWVLLHMGEGLDVFGLVGAFDKDGILKGKGHVRRVKSVSFSRGGLMMDLDLFDEEEESSSSNYVYELTIAPNIGPSVQDRLMVQAVWLRNARFAQLAPAGCVKNASLLAPLYDPSLAPRTEEGELEEEWTLEWPESEDEVCQKMLSCQPCPKGSLRERYLACYPGSGSKWLLGVVHQATGFATFGCLSPESKEYLPDAAFLIKTHHTDPNRWKTTFDVMDRFGNGKAWTRWSEDLTIRLQDMTKLYGRAVVLIRNPYESLVSFFNHDRSESFDAPRDYGVVHLPEVLASQKFSQFVRTEIVMWEEIYLDYLSAGSDLLVVHYEDLVSDLEPELRRMFSFLGQDVDEPRLGCTVREKSKKNDAYKRRKVEYEDPFTADLHELIEKAMENVGKMLKVRGQPGLPVEKYKWTRKERTEEVP